MPYDLCLMPHIIPGYLMKDIMSQAGDFLVINLCKLLIDYKQLRGYCVSVAYKPPTTGINSDTVLRYPLPITSY